MASAVDIQGDSPRRVAKGWTLYSPSIHGLIFNCMVTTWHGRLQPNHRGGRMLIWRVEIRSESMGVSETKPLIEENHP